MFNLVRNTSIIAKHYAIETTLQRTFACSPLTIANVVMRCHVPTTIAQLNTCDIICAIYAPI